MEEAAIVALEISLAAALDEWAGMGLGWGRGGAVGLTGKRRHQREDAAIRALKGAGCSEDGFT